MRVVKIPVKIHFDASVAFEDPLKTVGYEFVFNLPLLLSNIWQGVLSPKQLSISSAAK